MRHLVRISAATLTVFGLLSSAADARAQDAAPAPPTAAAPAPPPAAAAPAAPVPLGAPAAPAGADRTPDGNDEKAEPGRLRIGFNFLNGGIGTGGDLSGPVLGASFKIGYQLSRLMGVYGNISPFVWVGSSSTASTAGLDVGAIAGTQFTPVFSLTPVDLLEVAAGPSLDYLSGGSVSGAGATGGAAAFSGAYFGVHGKAALHLGGRNETTGRRRGFTIEGNVHPSFTPGSAVTFLTIGLGYDWH